MEPMQYIILFAVFAAIFLAAWHLMPKSKREKVVWERLMSEDVRESRKQRSSWIGFLSVLAPINRALRMDALRKKTKGLLANAGSTLTVDEFFALTELGALLLPLVYIIVVDLSGIEPAWLMAMVGLGLILPHFWLKQQTSARQQAIAKALPNVIDLLNLAVGAGLDFMVAVQKMVEQAQPDPLIDELSQLWHETRIGITRQEALRNLAQRVNLPEVSSFVRTLIQADKMGTGIEEALRLQAAEALTWRFQRAEQQALKAPIKMLFPLLVFILPVVLVIVGGPIILQFFQSGLLN